jgi:hypothetical protein
VGLGILAARHVLANSVVSFMGAHNHVWPAPLCNSYTQQPNWPMLIACLELVELQRDMDACCICLLVPQFGYQQLSSDAWKVLQVSDV